MYIHTYTYKYIYIYSMHTLDILDVAARPRNDRRDLRGSAMTYVLVSLYCQS